MSTYAADLQLGLHLDPGQLEWVYPKNCCLYVRYVLVRLPCLASVREEAPRGDLQCQGDRITNGDHSSSEKGRRDAGRTVGGDREESSESDVNKIN